MAVCEAHNGFEKLITEIGSKFDKFQETMHEHLISFEITATTIKNDVNVLSNRIITHKQERENAIKKIAANLEKHHKVLFEGNGDPALVQTAREFRAQKVAKNGITDWVFRAVLLAGVYGFASDDIRSNIVKALLSGVGIQ